MAMTPEAKVKKDIRQELLRWGLINAGVAAIPVGVKGWFYMPANNGMGVSGIPDFVGAIGPMGRFFSIEAKAGTGKPTANQLNRHAEIEAAHGIVIVAYGADDIQDLRKCL